MIMWMIYVEMVTLVLGGAALAAERALRTRRLSSRWVWATAMLVSLLIPVAGGSLSARVSQRTSPVAVATRLDSPAALAPIRWLGSAAKRTDSLPEFDDLLRSCWIVGSVSLALLLCGSGAALRWRRRGWTTRTIAGVAVYVAPDLGPAVVGLLRPCIVVPQWLDDLPAAQQKLVVAHEVAHLKARDPQLLAVALCALVCMPWNGVLWWQLKRLRRAIEVDRDAGILRSGVAARDYGETLLAVGQRQSSSMATVLAMSEEKTFLEERITLMLSKPHRSWARVAATFGGLSLTLVAVATQVGPPGATQGAGSTVATTGAAPPARMPVPAAVLDSYVGSYEYGEAQLTTVTRQGDHLLVQFPGWPALAMYPRSTTSFFSGETDATVSFTPGEHGAASAVLEQNGASTSMPRVDASTAQQIRAAMQAKMHAQQSNTAGAVALQRMIDGITAGKPDLAAMNPQLAAAIRKDLPTLQAKLASLGPVRSIEPAGVSEAGMDVYEVHHAHGSSQWSLALDSQGTIVGALVPL